MDNSANNNQNKPNSPASGEGKLTPIQSGPPSGQSSTAANPNQSPPAPSPQPSVSTPGVPGTVSIPLAEDTPLTSTQGTTSSVVASQPQDKLPKWFYFIFTIIVVVFLIITGLLVMTIINKQKSGGEVEILPTQAVSQDASQGITPTPLESGQDANEDQLTVTIGATSESDDVESLEKDINNSDITPLKKDLNNLEGELNPTP